MKIHEFILFGGVVFVIVTIVIAVAIAERRRRRLLAERLRELGLTSSLEDPTLSASEAFSRIGPLIRLRRGADGVRWHAQGQIDGLPITLLEHQYMVSSGKNRHAVNHTMAATPCPPSWPTLSVTSEHFFHKIAEFLGSHDIKVEDPNFNSRWRVKCDSQDFAILVLSPEVQGFMSSLQRGTWLEIGNRAICLVRRSRLDSEEVARQVRSLAELARLLPPELEVWQA